MFSGIVETTAHVLNVEEGRGVVRLEIEKPSSFQDVKNGDSISVNGICLTIEAHDEKRLQFALAPETLKVTGWVKESLKNIKFNLERSLKFSDRIHGHLVSGHVDAMAEVVGVEQMGESTIVAIQVPQTMAAYFWPKGSLAISGVSLTINKVENGRIEVCLIPETLKQTNLSDLKKGDFVTVEIDTMARGLVHWLEQRGGNHVST